MDNDIENIRKEIYRQRRFGVYAEEAKFILYIGRNQHKAILRYNTNPRGQDSFLGYNYLVVGGKESWVHLAPVL